MTEKTLEIKVKEIISSLLQMDASSIPSDMDLFKLGLDSISGIRMVVELEETFGITFEDEELLFENIKTVENICAVISAKK